MIRFLKKKYDQTHRQLPPETITRENEEKKQSCPHLQQQQGSEITTAETTECQFCKQEKRHALIYRLKLMAGLLLPFTLASLDLTIVASSTPFIASYFDKLDQLDWIVTAYTLTSTTFIPTFGQLADVFGRHAALQLSMGLMVVGSTLAAAAQTWGMLLLGRALQGTSAAGIMNIIVIVLADKVSLEENAKNNTVFTLVAGISYSVGPVVGGYLTNASWRYVFVISIPIAFVSHFIIYFLLYDELVEGTHLKRGAKWSWSTFAQGLATIDLGGSVLFIFGIGLIILGTTWGGSTYSWTSAAVLAPIIVGGVCFVLFFVYEYLLEPGNLLSNAFPRQVAMVPFAMYAVFYYISVYFIVAEGYSASQSGVNLLYYIPGMGAGAYIAMFMCNAWPAQTFFTLLAGTIQETVGLAVLTWAMHSGNNSVIKGVMVLAGAGTACRFMPMTLHVAGIWPKNIAPAMSLMRFAQPFGGTLALTIMGSVFNNKFAFDDSSSNSGLSSINVHDTSSLDSISSLPENIQQIVRTTGKNAAMWAFIAILPIMGISLVASLFLGNVWIKPKRKIEQLPPGTSEVIYVPYLYAILRGNLDSYKRISKPLATQEKLQHTQRASGASDIELLPR
ncbi:hypothetical protein UA08_05301 [Talaromyces atroroseus]|uniref:Major facilitator superfamily (MFS) profile domain-containing protein n=1 Tax=Talaromyces atroroseus TaxID=1441469 RepID=A0A225AE00_TALAT|nr:hypothetical protein UA08_05301 [Talaromyces atroroseus]OKL59442.1 hypothetical protein UA08_05301 [Talaromyces atroroseus]